MKITLTFTIKPQELAAIQAQLSDKKTGNTSELQCAKTFIEEAVQIALVDLMYEHHSGAGAVA